MVGNLTIATDRSSQQPATRAYMDMSVRKADATKGACHVLPFIALMPRIMPAAFSLAKHLGRAIRQRRAKHIRQAQPGDVIGVIACWNGVPYEHYGVYAGSGKVIHYAAVNGGNAFTDEVEIMETSLTCFLNGRSGYFVVDCELLLADDSLVGMLGRLFGHRREPFYSPAATIERARLRMGEREYNLLTNNCEHFAVWCKTGLKESHQVKRVLGLFRDAVIPIRI
ncbi:MAG: NC domain protein [bacterium ADurb.Bin429]|nr:MAG: NC domain protein [bacterium ADurb.Bin429]